MVKSIHQIEENIAYPVTPLTVATPVIPLPQHPNQHQQQQPLPDPPVIVPVHHHHHHQNKNEKDNTKYFRNRMILCLFAVAFNWGTTLRIANYLASQVILVPSIDLVTQTCKTAYNITRDERLNYSKCVESQLNQCNNKLDRTTKKEDDRVHKLTKHNENVVRRVEEITMNCSSAYTTLRMALEDWMANGGEIPLRSEDSDVIVANTAPPNPNKKNKKRGRKAPSQAPSSNPTEPICSAEDRAQFNQTILGTQNTLALQTEALKMASSYSDDSTSTVTRLATTVTDLDNEISALNTFIVERTKYDANYIDDKTQNIQDELYDIVQALDPSKVDVNIDDIFQDLVVSAVDIMACLSLDTDARMADGGICQPNLATMVDGFVEDAKYKVDFLTQTLYEYQDKMEEYKQNALDAYNVAKRFYDGAKAFINVARRIVFWENIGDWFDINDRDFFPIDVNFPNVDVAVGNVGPFGSINAMWEMMQPKIGAFYSRLALIPSRMKDRFGDVLETVLMEHSVSVFNLIPRILPDDYNPPTYVGNFLLDINPKDEVLMYKNKSELFLSNTRTALGMFSGIGNQYDADILNLDVPSFNVTEIKSKVTSVDIAFEGLQEPDMDYDLWFLQLSYLSDCFVLVDYIFRAYVTIRLLMRYWFATSLAMPNIDLRINKEVRNPFRMHPARAAVAFVTSPMGGFILFLATSTWLLGIIAALYIPMLKSYTSGCVRASGNGTFVTKNLYSIAYNHAYQDGSGLLIEGMDVFDVKRGDTCSSRYTTSATLQNTMSSNVSTYKNFHQELSNSMGFARRCINSDELDSAFTNACCGITTYPDCTEGQLPSDVTCPIDDRRAIMSIPIPHELPGISLAEPSCSANTNGSDWIIDNAVFDCEQLAECTVTCLGPRKNLLDSASERCGCTIEWYLHSKWMGTTFAFLLYVFMNIARVSFFSGITRLLWKHIYPERFTVLATCDSAGFLVTSSSKVSGKSHEDLINAIQTRSKAVDNNHTLSRELHTKLDRCLRNFYLTGFALLLGSLVANGVWLYALGVTSQSFTPYIWSNNN